MSEVDSAESAFRLRREFDKDFDRDSDDGEPETVNVSGRFGDFVLVGSGSITNPLSCGKFRYFGCLRTELHGRMRVDGKDYRGKAYVKVVPYSCDKPSCPVCYKYGWASREAHNIEARLKEASKRWGEVEHVVCSISPEMYGLDYEALRAKLIEALRSRGVIGGVMIFHGFRYNLRKWWYWSPHFHVLGFVLGGYGKCRACDKVCVRGCGGFVDKSYRLNETDKWIVKVATQRLLVDGRFVRRAGKRASVWGTARYQLDHATVRESATRFQVATWFGVCSYRKLKVTVERRKHLCPLCQHELVPLLSFCDDIVLDVSSADFKREFYHDVIDGKGRRLLVEDVREGKSY
jgi:hypothetical protein